MTESRLILNLDLHLRYGFDAKRLSLRITISLACTKPPSFARQDSQEWLSLREFIFP
jgi:hypothetical protein